MKDNLNECNLEARIIVTANRGVLEIRQNTKDSTRENKTEQKNTKLITQANPPPPKKNLVYFHPE